MLIDTNNQQTDEPGRVVYRMSGNGLPRYSLDRKTGADDTPQRIKQCEASEFRDFNRVVHRVGEVQKKPSVAFNEKSTVTKTPLLTGFFKDPMFSGDRAFSITNVCTKTLFGLFCIVDQIFLLCILFLENW